MLGPYSCNSQEGAHVAVQPPTKEQSHRAKQDKVVALPPLEVDLVVLLPGHREIKHWWEWNELSCSQVWESTGSCIAGGLQLSQNLLDNSLGCSRREFLEAVECWAEYRRCSAQSPPQKQGKLVKDIKDTAVLPCRNHRIGALNPVRQSQEKITSLDFRKANFGLLRDLLGRCNGRLPWREEGHRDSCLEFRASLLRAWEWATVGLGKSSKHGRRPAQPSEELRLQKEAQGKWKQWWVTPEEHRDVALACRGRIWRLKAQLELKQNRAVKATMVFHGSALTAKRKDEKIWVSCCSWTFSWSRAGLGDLWDWDFLAYTIWGQVLASTSCCGVPVEGEQHRDKKGFYFCTEMWSQHLQQAQQMSGCRSKYVQCV